MSDPGTGSPTARSEAGQRDLLGLVDELGTEKLSIE